MLQAIRTEGSKPPFFVVHGFHGIMAIGHAMGRALDGDQPLYVLHARGIDGAEPPHQGMEDMLAGYLAEIRAVRPHGPYVVGGACAGTLVALELSRALTAQGERVSPAVLIDPPSVPVSQIAGFRSLDPSGDPGVYRQLYASTEQVFRSFAASYGNLPFDVNNPAQMQRAIEVGMRTVVRFCRYVPPRFDGATVIIVSSDRALGHLHPQYLWQQIVSKPSRMHVIPGTHADLFSKHLDEVLRLVRFTLDSPFEA